MVHGPAQKLKLRILSMSFGGPVNPSAKDDILVQAVEKAVKAGLTVVIAAGNSGPGRRTVESPGISPSAITVGAVNDRRTVTQRTTVSPSTPAEDRLPAVR